MVVGRTELIGTLATWVGFRGTDTFPPDLTPGYGSGLLVDSTATATATATNTATAATRLALTTQPVDVPLWVLTVAGLLVIATLMAVSGFFSSSEIAMFALKKHRLDALVDEDPRATTAKELREDPHRTLVTILVGNNVANVAMSSVATALLGFYVTGWQAVLLTTVGITSLVLLFSESAPKAYAIENTESWALTIAKPLKMSGTVLAPFVIVFDSLTRIVNGLVGAGTNIESAYVTREELRQLIDAGRAEGVIEPDERDRLLRIFRFSETPIREIMVPRPDVVAVPTTADLESAIQTCVYTGFTHLPVYEGELDTVVGTVHVCDLVRDFWYGERSPENLTVADVMQPTIHVPETIPADEVLGTMQREHVHLATVIDEYGTTEGIVTTEDPTELIVGEILAPREPVPIQILDERRARIRGDVTIADVNESLGVSLPEIDHYDTVAGLVLNRISRLASEGEQIRYDDLTLVVEEVSNARVGSVRLESDEPFGDRRENR